MMMKVIVFVIFTSSFANSRITLHESDNIVVQTLNGLIRGTLDQTRFEKKDFYSFQSIPYAEPPIGNLRFQDPKPAKNWTGILETTSEPKACLQILMSEENMSENCLFLNVFTPTLNSSASLSVLFWIHGGYFIFGSGKKSNNNPDLFIEQNIVFVSINYRLGVFGYLSSDDEVIPGNFGMKDQILALEWVQKNIHNFGGNPAKVSVMGQSAGAASVGLLLESPRAKNLFSSAILESGNSLNLWSRNPNPTLFTKNIAKIHKIDYNSSLELLEKLQEIKNVSLLISASSVQVIDTASLNPANGLICGPTLDRSSDLLPSALHEALANGNFNKIPVLTGFNSGEANMFLPFYALMSLFVETYNFNPRKLVPTDLNNNQTSVLETIGKMVKKYYFGRKLTVPKQLFTKFVNDDEFIRPATEFVRQISKFTPTFLYEFSYEGDLPPVGPKNRELPGTTHGEELSYIFPSDDEGKLNEKDEITRKRMIKLWTNFIKYNDPTPEKDGNDQILGNITWIPVQGDVIDYLNINYTLEIAQNPGADAMDFWKNIYENYGVPPFDTY